MPKILFLLLLLSNVVLADDLPDKALTPGVSRGLTLDKICMTTWGKDVRLVSASMKHRVYDSYGMHNHSGACAIAARGCEVDHLISRELGGADDVKNLWPQPYGGTWNAVMKDNLENKLHALICAPEPTMTLDEAQDCISTDWIACFKKVSP
jgi:hypothetical protein